MTLGLTRVLLSIFFMMNKAHIFGLSSEHLKFVLYPIIVYELKSLLPVCPLPSAQAGYLDPRLY